MARQRFNLRESFAISVGVLAGALLAVGALWALLMSPVLQAFVNSLGNVELTVPAFLASFALMVIGGTCGGILADVGIRRWQNAGSASRANRRAAGIGTAGLVIGSLLSFAVIWFSPSWAPLGYSAYFALPVLTVFLAVFAYGWFSRDPT